MSKFIHFIWIGNTDLPVEFTEYISNWRNLYDDYEIIIWNDKKINDEIEIPVELRPFYYDRNMKIAFRVDILRYLILKEYGGMYIDVDFEPLKKIPDVFFNFDFLGAIQPNSEVAIGFIYSKPNTNLIVDVIEKLAHHLNESKSLGMYDNSNLPYLTGPSYFNSCCKKYFNNENYYFFTCEYFYPYWFEEFNRRNENFKITSPLSYAVHHWNGSWLK